MKILKPIKIYQDPFAKRVNSNRPTRKKHGVRGRQNECLISFPNIFDFESLCKPIRNHAYSWTSIKTMNLSFYIYIYTYIYIYIYIYTSSRRRPRRPRLPRSPPSPRSRPYIYIYICISFIYMFMFFCVACF